ncbi:membrane protein [Actinomadura sp. NBRC 104425]|uniref:EI24 domain-containing protein n=1 Tax=Actinomadura sp. NBRC 104425 TaxID=3032204 RepID=UPI0024A57E02|nr:EI24 domain-containing protein [Actinomadura sp. NBRC 104425]GLZ10249.1 membrane protein [Actinomadura sp. NBRC 104425]
MVQPYEQHGPGVPGRTGRPVQTGPHGAAGPQGPMGQVNMPGGAEAPRPSWFKDLFNGVGYLFRGLAWVARRPAQWLFGLIPALIVLAVYAAGLVALAWNLGDLAGWVTPFADGWSSGLRDATRIVAGVAIFGAALFLAVVTFTAVTLLVGDPFYEAISVRVEESQGGAPPEPDVPLLTQIGRAIGDAIVMGLIALLFAVLFFACGFLPVVGQTVVPVVAACVSGSLLAVELTSVALERRGLLRRDRLAVLRRYRPLAVGFGVATFVTFMVPLAAVVMMPAAVAGATLMVRERLIVS